MRTWNDYKEHVAAVDPDIAKDIREAEAMSAIVKAMVEQRNAMGLSQRELAFRNPRWHGSNPLKRCPIWIPC